MQWVWGLDRLAPVSSTDCAEAVLRAMLDPHVSRPAEKERETDRQTDRERREREGEKGRQRLRKTE